MNYLEIFNKVALELNYRPVDSLKNVFRNDHLRILENINQVNEEICTYQNWSFLPENFKTPGGEFICAVSDNEYTVKMIKDEDYSIIPEPYRTDLLVYGTCIKTKADPQYPKFSFWNCNYMRALARLREHT